MSTWCGAPGTACSWTPAPAGPPRASCAPCVPPAPTPAVCCSPTVTPTTRAEPPRSPNGCRDFGCWPAPRPRGGSRRATRRASVWTGERRPATTRPTTPSPPAPRSRPWPTGRRSTWAAEWSCVPSRRPVMPTATSAITCAPPATGRSSPATVSSPGAASHSRTCSPRVRGQSAQAGGARRGRAVPRPPRDLARAGRAASGSRPRHPRPWTAAAEHDLIPGRHRFHFRPFPRSIAAGNSWGPCGDRAIVCRAVAFYRPFAVDSDLVDSPTKGCGPSRRAVVT